MSEDLKTFHLWVTTGHVHSACFIPALDAMDFLTKIRIGCHRLLYVTFMDRMMQSPRTWQDNYPIRGFFKHSIAKGLMYSIPLHILESEWDLFLKVIYYFIY
jgi:hypothetical protein